MRVGSLIPALLGAALTAGVLAWNDVLPGGWTLKGYLAPHELRRALEQSEHRVGRLQAFAAEEVRSATGAVAFLGSSTVERFPLAEHFPGKPTLNLGIGSESAAAFVDRLARSLPEAELSGALLYVGSIDFRERERSPQMIAVLAGAAIAELRERQPGVPVGLIGILPEQGMQSSMVARLRETNDALRELALSHACAFIATDRPPITAEDGSLDPGYAADRLHLNSAGYGVLARWILEDGGELGELLAP